MSTIDIFRDVDDVIELFEKKKDIYRLIAEEIKELLEHETLLRSKYEMTVTYRIKTPESLREKLIRNNYIARFGMENALASVQDIIGLRMECKFIDDEHYAFELLRDVFTKTDDGMWFYQPDMPRVRLKLGERQPQRQKNGFSIYKIDGFYTLGREQMRFEVQIKAMVNLFWSEIEHRIMYKNNSYLIADDYISDLMVSIKKSLNMIDSQLHVLYKHYKREEKAGEASRIHSLKKMVGKMIHDVFAERLGDQLGLSLNFKVSCEAIVDYLSRSRDVDSDDYAALVYKLLLRLSEIRSSELGMDEVITLSEDALTTDDAFSQGVIKAILHQINSDYNWHLFFQMIISLSEPEQTPEQAVASYVAYYRGRIARNYKLSNIARDEIRADVLAHIGETISHYGKVEIFYASGISRIHSGLNAMGSRLNGDRALRDIDWPADREKYFALLDAAID